MRPKFTVADVEKAHDELKPHIAPLVAQFGPTQAHEIVTSALRDLVGEFPVEAPQVIWLPPGARKRQAPRFVVFEGGKS
jgi:hypothetical protein